MGQDYQEYHEEHKNANLDMLQDDNHDDPQEKDIDPIDKSLENEDNLH